PLGERFFPERFLREQIEAVELFRRGEVKPAGDGRGADAFHVVRRLLLAVRGRDPLDELVSVIDVEDEDAGAAEFQQVADTRRRDVEVTTIRQSVRPQ